MVRGSEHMRHLSIALVLLGLPVIAAAQHSRPPATPPAPTRSALGPIGLPLPSIGLPLGSSGLSPRTLGLSPLPLAEMQPAPEYRPQMHYQPGLRHRPRQSFVYV